MWVVELELRSSSLGVSLLPAGPSLHPMSAFNELLAVMSLKPILLCCSPPPFLRVYSLNLGGICLDLDCLFFLKVYSLVAVTIYISPAEKPPVLYSISHRGSPGKQSVLPMCSVIFVQGPRQSSLLSQCMCVAKASTVDCFFQILCDLGFFFFSICQTCPDICLSRCSAIWPDSCDC